MAEDKKSFVAYADWKTQFNLLSDDEAGRLIKHIFSYVNDENPEFEASERLLTIAFEPIKMQLKRDLKKYELIKDKRSKVGKKGGLKSGEVRAESTNQNEANEANASFAKQKEANEAVTVNDNVNDTVTVNVNDTVINNSLLGAVAQKKSFGKPDFRKSLIELGANEQHVEDWIKVRTAKRASFTETVIQSLIKECQQNNFSIADAVRISAEQSWQGFKYSWTLNLNNNGKSQSSTNQSRQQRVDEVANLRVNNQQSLAERLQKHITSSPE